MLIEVEKKTLRPTTKIKILLQLKIKVYPHNILNSWKGVVKSPDLSLCTLDEIKNNLRKRGITDAKQISIKRNNQIITTNTYILNFNTPKPPIEIKIGYLITKVETYIPNSLRCHNCQKFGHHKEKGTRPPICKNCGETGNHIDCQWPPKCANKIIQQIQKNVNYGKKNTRSKAHQTYILPGSEEVHWKLSSHNYLCNYSQTHKQLYPKSRNDSPLWYNKSNKRIEDSTQIIKGKFDI